jgi:hypothetical protein
MPGSVRQHAEALSDCRLPRRVVEKEAGSFLADDRVVLSIRLLPIE